MSIQNTNHDNSARSARGAKGLPGKYVTSPAIEALEAERIFDQRWICVARVEELDPTSDCLPIQVGNRGLFLTRDEHGTIRAFSNFCRHRGSQLVNESNCAQMGKRIQCPYHAWTYDRAGKLISAPNMSDLEGFELADHGLLEFACESYAGFVWVNFKPQQRLTSYLAPLADQLQDWQVANLRIAKTLTYEVQANWKLIFQNYSECYHCPSVHPALNRLTPYRGSSNDLDSGPILGGPMSLSDDSQTMSSDGKFAGLPIAGLRDEQLRSVHYFTLFPTMFLSLHPDYVLTHRLEPTSTRSTKVVCQFLFHPEALQSHAFHPDLAYEFWDLTNRQDWKVCELAQIGMSDPNYVPGPYSNLESVLAAFDQHYLETLEHND